MGVFGVFSNNIKPQANDPNSIIILLIVLAVIIIGVILAVVKGAGNPSGSSGGFSLKKKAKEFGLDPQQLIVLRKAIRVQKLSNPSSLFTNGRYLNTCLKKLMVEVDSTSLSAGEKESFKSLFLDIKQKIASHTPGLDKILTTKVVPINQDVVLYSRSFPPFKSEIAGKTTDYIVASMPSDSHGEWIQYKTGEPIKVRYIKDDEKVFSFVSRVADIKEVEGVMRLLLTHSANVKQVQLRQSPRKDFHRSAFFYRVDIVVEGQGRKAVQRAAVDKNRRYSGTMSDISAGGCALICRNPLGKNSLIMISFDIMKGNTINVFGKVRNIKKERGGSMMNIMFTKVSTKSLNEIRSLVFDFTENEDKPRNHYMTY